MSKAKPYIFSILLSLTAGGLSALATANNMNIYDKINMPSLSPPGWLFPIVWTILFILMGISAAMIFTSNSAQKESALFVYAISLVLNFSWSIIFFNTRAFFFAFMPYTLKVLRFAIYIDLFGTFVY